MMKRTLFLFALFAFIYPADAQILTLVDSVQLSNAQIWGVSSDAGDSLCVTTTFNPGTKPHLFIRKINYNTIGQSTPKQLTFDSDFTGITNLTDHKSIILNNELFVSFSTQGDKDIFLFKTDINGNRIGSIKTVVQNSPDPTNDMILSTDGTFIFVLHFDPPYQHHVYKYNSNLDLIQPSYSTATLNHNNLGNAVFSNGDFYMFSGTKFGFNANLILTKWTNSWAAAMVSPQIIVNSSGGDGNFFSTGVAFEDADSRWYIGMNHIYSNQAIGQEHIDLLALDNNFMVLERQHVTSANFARSHFVIKGNYLYMTYDKPGNGVYLHKYLIQNNTAVKENQSQEKLLIYPNPASSSINISAKEYTTPFSLGFYNLFGDLLEQISLDENNPETTLDIRKYAPGIYFIKTTCGQVYKIVF